MIGSTVLLLALLAGQVILYEYLRRRLPDPRHPGHVGWVRGGLTGLFLVMNFPWVFFVRHLYFGSVWNMHDVPLARLWLLWQLLSGVLLGTAGAYHVAKLVRRWLARHGQREPREETVAVRESRRAFLRKAVYGYGLASVAIAAHGLWNSSRQPVVARRDLPFPGLPPPLDGLRLLHMSDVHAGVHMDEGRMHETVAIANSLAPDVVIMTGDMIDTSTAFISDYVHAYRNLTAPFGVVTVLGNHDLYTGEARVRAGVLDAGHVLVENGHHVLEAGGAHLTFLGVTDPGVVAFDPPQDETVDRVAGAAPSDGVRILLAHRPAAFDAATRLGIALTLAGHTHGGQIGLPFGQLNAARLMTRYVAGLYVRGDTLLYVNRGIGTVGVPVRIGVAPEVAVLTLRRKGPMPPASSL